MSLHDELNMKKAVRLPMTSPTACITVAICTTTTSPMPEHHTHASHTHHTHSDNKCTITVYTRSTHRTTANTFSAIACSTHRLPSLLLVQRRKVGDKGAQRALTPSQPNAEADHAPHDPVTLVPLSLRSSLRTCNALMDTSMMQKASTAIPIAALLLSPLSPILPPMNLELENRI